MSSAAPAGVYVWQVVVARRIDSYVPSGSPPGWSRVAGEVRRVVAAAEPLTPYSAGELLSVLAKLALFADGEGTAARAEAWLSREYIERFIGVGCPHVGSATRGNYRSKLLRLREAVLGGDNPTGRPVKLSSSDSAAPYSAAELSALVSWAHGQPTEELRAGCLTLLALGRGCGLDSPEVIPLRVHDICQLANGAVTVNVRGPRARVVVCRRAWEQELREAADRIEAPGVARYLFRHGCHTRSKNTVTNFLARTHRSPGTPALRMGRLRAGWLVELIEANLPLTVLLAASGVDSLHGLSRVLPHVKGPAPDQAGSLLRGHA